MSDIVIQLWMKSERDELMKHIRAASRIGDLAAYRGNLFEAFSHNQLREGGKYRVRKLLSKDMKTTEIELPKRSIKSISSPADIKDLTNTEYGIPVVSNFAAVDAVTWSGFFQAFV